MKFRGVTLIVAMLMVLLVCPTAPAADGWLSSWMPGGNSKPATTTKKSGSWFPWIESKPKPPAAPKVKGPSTFTKVTQGTKNAWNKTVDFINPFDNKPASTSSQSKSSSGGGWFSSKPEPKPITSVPDFLGQERPTY